jgi:hypothetical protein
MEINMITLQILVGNTTITVIERDCMDVRYMETFNNWYEVFYKLEKHMDVYDGIDVRWGR